MFENIKKAFIDKEIRAKILWTLFFILLYRIGCHIPVPGIGDGLFTGAGLADISYLQIMSMMSGGALANGTWFAMGIGPYINASIIIQLLTVAIPALERLSKLGEEGQKKISTYTRYGALILAIIQSIGIIVSNNGGILVSGDNSLSLVELLGNQEWLAYILLVVIYASGTLATVFIGERITEKGVSNGISMLIFIGILSSAGIAFIAMITTAFGGDGDLMAFWRMIGYVIAIIIVFGCIVFIELSERKIPVQYAKMIKGRKQYGGQSTVIPIKVNSNGVMPLIFAFSILSFPELIITMFWSDSNFARWWQTWMGTRSVAYMIVLVILIFLFAFFYSSIQFNPDDISKTIQQNGGFIPGYRPGKPTAIYLRQIQTRITLFGALFLAFIALVPAVVFRFIDDSISSAFSATGMLIAVSVALEFNSALESQIMMKSYKGFLK